MQTTSGEPGSTQTKERGAWRTAHLQVAVAVEEDVARLEVAVQHVGRVDVLEAAQDLVDKVLAGKRGGPALYCKPRSESAVVVVASFSADRNAPVVVRERLRRADDLVQVRVHELGHDVDVLKVRVARRPQDVIDGDDLGGEGGRPRQYLHGGAVVSLFSAAAAGTPTPCVRARARPPARTFSWSKCRRMLISRSVRLQSVRWSNAREIFLMATLRPSTESVAELAEQGGALAPAVPGRVSDQAPPRPQSSWAPSTRTRPRRRRPGRSV